MKKMNMRKLLKNKGETLKLTTLGFTLVELLSVIVILGIVLIIAVPGVLSIINKTKENAYQSQLSLIKDTARTYVTTTSPVWTDDTVVVSLSDLQYLGMLDKKLIDPRDKSEMKGISVLVTRLNNRMKYELVYSDSSNANYPVLSSGMIPIRYDGTNWVKADYTNEKQSWFDYSKQNWANIATVTSDVRDSLIKANIGTVVPMDKINTMFVWIPRFDYKLFNVDGTVSPVGNRNLAGDMTIDVKMVGLSEKLHGTKNGEWLTHPAFTFGEKELTGFWVGKFETGYNGAVNTAAAAVQSSDVSKIVIKPNVYSWVNNPFKYMFDASRSMKNDNTFGVSLEGHVTKNMEWGAMAYFTNSTYGKTGNGKYVGDERNLRINNNLEHLTGCGASVRQVTTTEACNTYETINGQGASTTGNVTGVYDTSGGVYDYVAAVMKNPEGTHAIVSGSKFTQEELDQLVNEGKYFDVYDYRDVVSFSTGKLGDGTIEIAPLDPVTGFSKWDKSAPGLPMLQSSFIIRGHGIDDMSLNFQTSPTGIFVGGSAGGGYVNRGFRISLS